MKTFILLGITNARRNLARSMLAILSMSLAAGFLTYSISLSRGYTQLYKADCRAIVGGEVIVYARQFGGTIPQGESRWSYQKLSESPLTDLDIFHPELLTHGYLSSEQHTTAFSADDLQFLATVSPQPKTVYPRYQLPAITVNSFSRRSTPLHGRVSSLDAQLARQPDELLVDGRWFNEDDEGQLVAVISAKQHKLLEDTLPQIGDTISIEIPSIIYRNDEPVFLYAQPLQRELTIIGIVEAETRLTSLPASGQQAPLYWQLDEVQIPFSTWDQLWRDAGGKLYQPEQVALQYENLSYLEDIVFELREALPEYTFYSVAEHFGQAERRGLIENIPADLLELVSTEATQAAMPLDLRLPFTVLIFVNAALVVASNLLIMVQQRQKEIGILKAVGALRSQIMLMVLAEAALIAFIGAACGFVFFRFPATLTQLTNHLSMATILSTTAYEGLVVAGVTLLFTSVFGLLPGLRMAGLPAMEVLRSE